VRTRILVLALAIAFWPAPAAQEPGLSRTDPGDEDVKLPSGKSQREEILKDEHEKSLRDAAQLIKLSTELQAALEKDDYHVLSLTSLKKTEDIEKIARRIRNRLKH
jgi:hypothetical protein